MTTPIPTPYKGVTYRSRLEAHSARFLTQAQIPFEYEHRRYALGDDNLWYWPDFWVARERLYIETKGYLDPISERKVRGLAAAKASVGVRVMLLWGVRPDTGECGRAYYGERVLPGGLLGRHSMVAARCRRCRCVFWQDLVRAPVDCPACGECDWRPYRLFAS